MIIKMTGQRGVSRCRFFKKKKKKGDTASNELYSLLFNYFLSFTSHRKVNKLCLSFWQLKIILLAVRV